MSDYGCPYRKDVFGRLLCTCSGSGFLDDVTGFVMCECDWESCPDFIAERDKREARAKAEAELIENCRRDSYGFECELRDCCECRQYLDYASEEQLQLLGEK